MNPLHVGGAMLAVVIVIGVVLLIRRWRNQSVPLYYSEVAQPEQAQPEESTSPRENWWLEYTIVYSKTSADSTFGAGTQPSCPTFVFLPYCCAISG